jgi:hypothetical protein
LLPRALSRWSFEIWKTYENIVLGSYLVKTNVSGMEEDEE